MRDSAGVPPFDLSANQPPRQDSSHYLFHAATLCPALVKIMDTAYCRQMKITGVKAARRGQSAALEVRAKGNTVRVWHCCESGATLCCSGCLIIYSHPCLLNQQLESRFTLCQSKGNATLQAVAGQKMQPKHIIQRTCVSLQQN